MDIKLFGALALVIGWFAIILLLVVWGADKSKSISYHQARHRKGFFSYGLLISLSLILLLIFGLGWLRPHYNLPVIFTIFYLIAIVGFGIATWVPVSGRRGRLHDKLAGTATVSMIPILVILALSPNVSNQASIIAFLGIVTLGSLFFAFKAIKGYHLVIQVSYFLVFDLTLVAVAFL